VGPDVNLVEAQGGRTVAVRQVGELVAGGGDRAAPGPTPPPDPDSDRRGEDDGTDRDGSPEFAAVVLDLRRVSGGPQSVEQAAGVVAVAQPRFHVLESLVEVPALAQVEGVAHVVAAVHTVAVGGHADDQDQGTGPPRRTLAGAVGDEVGAVCPDPVEGLVVEVVVTVPAVLGTVAEDDVVDLPRRVRHE
jgi:hypothetical protein